jgi:hypothetical protein
MYGVRLHDGNNRYGHGLHHRLGRAMDDKGFIQMKENIIETLKKHYEAKILEHKLNIDIMMANPRAIPEHENFSYAIDKELAELANAHDKLEALLEYF